MAKRIHIVIAEPSAILRCGIISILHQIQSVNLDIIEISDISTMLSHTYRIRPDLLIINPYHLGIFSMVDLKSGMGNEKLKVIALQSAFTDQTLLQNYDDAISIYDGIEVVVEKVIGATKRDVVEEARKELSVREKEIIVCVVKGMTNKLIAETLCLSTHTVIAHRRNIANKLQIHSPSGLTIYAIVNKLVDLTDIKNSISQTKEIE